MFGNNVLGIIFACAHEERVRDLTELRVMASVTRDAGALIDVRIPDALESGLLEATAEAEITPQASRVMLCGNPAMVKAVRAAMRARGIVSPRNGEPGQLLAENFWL